MVSRKRTRAEVEENGVSESPAEPGLLHRLRSMWEFANLMQYIFTFGKMVKISDDIEIDDLEAECLKPEPSETLLEIGLSLLKFVSSHRGLIHDNFEEYTRRQYYAKAPSRNPFGDDEQPIKFNRLDVFQKIRVLQQLSAWTFWNPDRVRERMPEQKENEQTQWRVEEIGYDRHDRLYYVLDDNRLYRRTDPPIPPPKASKPKANSKKGRALARAARKRKAASMTNSVNGEEEDDQKDEAGQNNHEEDTSKGYKWECIAVTLAEYQQFVDSLEKTKDPNEKILRDAIIADIIPVIQQVEEAHQRKIQRRERELINMQKMANAKRSSRLQDKHERERQQIQAAEEQRRLEAEQIAARKKEEMQAKIEKERLYRLMTREQRLKDREEKRKQQQEQMAAIAEQTRKMENGESRLSERHLKAELAKRQQQLEALKADEDQWFFDCSGCGVHGENLDDGTHSVACEKCSVWQHSKCLGIPQEEAERDDFHFVCKECQRRIEDAKKPKLPPLRFRLPTSVAPSSESAVPVNGEEPKPNLVPQSMNGATTATQGAAVNRPQPAEGWFRPPAPTYKNSTNVNGSSPSPQPFQAIHNQRPPQHVQPNSSLKVIQHYAPVPNPAQNAASASFNSRRPSSSFGQSPMSSPIQNRPSMSPTQGNRDVGPLAGIPSSSPSGGTPVPFGSQPRNIPSFGSPYPVGPPPNQSPSVSFSSTGPQPTSSFGQTPPPPSRYSPGLAMSGLSPTKHSPPRPPAFGGVGNASVLPPIQALQPSPKLMGRSSPDAPIPAPMKSMTPEQEDRRRRENMLAAQELMRQQQIVAPDTAQSSPHNPPS